MTKGAQLAKNTLIIAAGKLSTQFLLLFLLPIYTYFLTPEEYGRLDIILIYIILAAPLLTVQMEMAVFRHLIDSRSDKQQSRVLISSSAMVGLIGLASVSILFAVLDSILNIPLTPYIIGVFISTAIANYLLQAARGLGRNGLFAITSFAIGLSTVLLSILFLIIMGGGLAGVLGANIVANAIGAILVLLAGNLLKYFRFSSIRRKEIHQLLAYSWPLTFNHAGLWAITGLNRTIIAVVLGLSAAGIFAAASRIPLIYTGLFSIFAMAWTEAVALHISAKDKDAFFSQVTDSAARLFGSIAIGLISIIGILFPLFFGSDFLEARPLIPLLVAGSLLGSIVTYFGAIYLAKKQTKQVALMTLQAVVIMSALTIIGIYFVGVYAAAAALVFTYLYIAIRRAHDIRRYVSIKYRPITMVWLLLILALVVLLYYINNPYLNIVSLITSIATGILLNKKSIVVLYRGIIKKSRQVIRGEK